MAGDPRDPRQGRSREVVDVEDDYFRFQIRAIPARPDPCVSGVRQPQPPKNLPLFPKTNELVFDESNTHLLQHLLPVLKECRCLEITGEERRRSPYTKAFCKIYHPHDGPWGSSKFSNAPTIFSDGAKKNSKKFSFKSYFLPTIYKHLKKYEGRSRVHLELREALDEFYEKEEWQKEFLRGCKRWGAAEANKPLAERAATPTKTGVNLPKSKSEGTQTDEKFTRPQVQQGVQTDEVLVSGTNPSADDPQSTKKIVAAKEKRNGKRRAAKIGEKRSVRRRSIRLQGRHKEANEEIKEENPDVEEVYVKPEKSMEVETDDEEEKEELDIPDSPEGVKPNSGAKEADEEHEDERRGECDMSGGAKPPSVVSPLASRDTTNRRETLQRSRDDLVELRSQRLGRSGTAPDDALCKKMQGRIDTIEEELMMMMMM